MEIKFRHSESEVGLLNIQVGLKVAQQSVTQNVAIIVINLVTPKARAKHEHLFNEPASGSFSRPISC